LQQIILDTLAVNPTFVKNVRNVNVDASDLTYGTDYTVNYGTGVISFTSPQTGAYIIDYDQGTNDKIYPDFPQPHLKLVNFPRIAVDIIAGTTTEVELGGGSNWSQYVVNISCYDRDQEDVENMIADIREAIIANKKSFYAFEFITPTAMGPILVSEFGQNKIFQRNQDCSILLVYED